MLDVSLEGLQPLCGSRGEERRDQLLHGSDLSTIEEQLQFVIALRGEEGGVPSGRDEESSLILEARQNQRIAAKAKTWLTLSGPMEPRMRDSPAMNGTRELKDGEEAEEAKEL